MKNIILTIFIFAALFSSVFSQPYQKRKGQQRHHSKIEELEKLKLIDILDMDEETTLKFFARRNEHKNEMNSLMKERGDLISKYETKLTTDEQFKDSEYEKMVSEILNTESAILNNRMKFIKSLNDILSEKQIARLVVFEFKFRREVQDMFNKRRFRD